MNYKNILLLAFLLPISVTEAKNNKTTDQEKAVTAQAMKNNVTPRKKIIRSYSQKYFLKLFLWTAGWYLIEYGWNFFERKFHTTFIECFCFFTIADNLLLDAGHPVLDLN